jgi:dihydrofolate reductase
VTPHSSSADSRRLRQSLLVSLNGVTSEPMAWAGPYFGPGSASASLAALRSSSALLMGRTTYEIFSRQWPAASGEYADFLNAMQKYVFSSTLTDAPWHNTQLVSGDVVAAVAELKRTPGRDLMVYGHGQFGQTLIDAGLVDELTLMVVPVCVDDGTPMYRPGGTAQTWDLVSAGPGKDPGLASLTYRPTRTAKDLAQPSAREEL